MTAPDSRQIEKASSSGQHLGIQADERGDGPFVDLNDLARDAVEMVVRGLVVSRIDFGREHSAATVSYRAASVRPEDHSDCLAKSVTGRLELTGS